MAFEDRQQLDAFVEEVYDVLRTVIFERSNWLPGDLWTSYEVAFMALAGSVEDTRTTLLPERFTDPSAEYQQGLDIALERAGLTGTQLELKLSGWRRAVGFFRAGPTRRLFRRALRWAQDGPGGRETARGPRVGLATRPTRGQLGHGSTTY